MPPRRDSTRIDQKSSFLRYWVSTIALIAMCVAGLWTIRSCLDLKKSPEQLVEEGRTAFSDRDFRRAVDCAERAIRVSPQFPPAWRLLSEGASRNGQIDRSLVGLEELARLRPEEAGKLGIQLGLFWMKQNQIRPAIRALNQSEQLNVDVPDALQMQSQIAAVTGHPRETARCIVELLKRGVFSRGDMMVVTALNPGVTDSSRLEAILKADPTNKSPYLAQALYEMNRNRIDEAERWLVEITAAHPDDLEAQGFLAELYATFVPEKFLSWHARLPACASDDARIWSARGKWLAHAGHTPSAVRCLHESLSREPEQLSTTATIGQLLKSLGETEIGNLYTERGRRLLRIVDLNTQLNEPKSVEQVLQTRVLQIVEELEATGRLWEAWGWCVVQQSTKGNRLPLIDACKNRLEARLHRDIPRTIPGSLPGGDFTWDRFPLPDWTRMNSMSDAESSHATESQTRIRFEDDAERAGVDFRYVNSYLPQRGRKIHETTGGGVAVLDFDRDGWPDLYFPQGNSDPRDPLRGPSDCLYRNLFGERFEQVSAQARIDERSYSQGVAAGDFDNDGFEDLYVANLGRNRLFRNNGDGTFVDVTAKAGLKQEAWTVSCAIADLNGDGLPELFDVNYVQSSELLTGYCLDAKQRPTVCRPTVFDPATDTVAINLGNGEFLEQQSEAGLDLPQGRGLGLVIADFNDDDRVDVFVANDMTANYLLINRQTAADDPLRFRDEAFLRNVALDGYGLAQACMGVACADINRDRQLDLFVTNFAAESNTLYLSQSDGFYHDATQRAGLRKPSFDRLGFGTQFLDVDRDGWFDLVVTNGHIDEYLNQQFRMQTQIFRGHSDGRFRELTSDTTGPLFNESRLGRGLALLDWNRDGRIDFVATDLDASVVLATNRTESRHRSLRLRLVGTRCSRDAIGAKVRVVVTSGDERVLQVTAGDGYESSNERFVEIGVGDTEKVSFVEVRWISGFVSRFDDLACDGDWLVIEGRSSPIRGHDR